MAKKVKNKKVEKLEKLTQELFKLLEVEAKIDVSEDKIEGKQGEYNVYQVNIDPQSQTGLLIGSHGETLKAIQSFLTISMRETPDEWFKVVVNIGDWREKQEEYLVNLANQTTKRALESKAPQYLYNLTPADRRIIHLALAKNKEVETVSEGEGRERYLVIKPR